MKMTSEQMAVAATDEPKQSCRSELPPAVRALLMEHRALGRQIVPLRKRQMEIEAELKELER